ncbi:MAG: hypothetical protein V7723_11035 [Sneathiella sp.]|uniref:hypothetical protein n=1 Tax=Sneathiella sp. TaxID=1964365 RepID=UPI0030014C6F
MNSLFRFSALVLFVIFVGACQPRIQPIYVPSSVAVSPGLETAPLSVIRDGILAAGVERNWVMKELEPGVIRGTLDVQNKHQAVVDVVYTNQSFDIDYISSRNLLSQGARIHRSYNTWVRQLEISISSNLSYLSSQQQVARNAPVNSSLESAVPAPTVTEIFDPAGYWNVQATYSPTAMNNSVCPKQRNWDFQLDYRKRGGISETYWSDGVQLIVTGKHSEETSELAFSVPDGGNNWYLIQTLKLNSPQVRLTAEPKSSASSGSTSGPHSSSCIGVIDVVMNKQN